MNFGDHLRTTGGALKNWAVAQFLDSLAVAVLWLIGLYILHVPLAPMWALIAAVVQIVHAQAWVCWDLLLPQPSGGWIGSTLSACSGFTELSL